MQTEKRGGQRSKSALIRESKSLGGCRREHWEIGSRMPVGCEGVAIERVSW